MPELLRDHTTLRLGGPARAWVVATNEAELIEAVSAADAAGEPVLILGGGSNLVVADAGFEGTVIEVAIRGIRADVDGPDGASCEVGAGPDDPSCGGALVTVAAGEPWDDLVAYAVRRGWIGVEALSGIPGSVGATPIQNVGAYGQEVGQTIAQVRTWDRTAGGIRTFAAADCDFSYRHSRFKATAFDAWGGRYVVLSVTFQLRQGTLGEPVAYGELARRLGIEVGQRAPLTDIRTAVLELRRGKGMVLDASDHDTWSAGSFFTNPIIDPAQVPEGAPSYPQSDGSVKTSAAWLIEHAGFAKGHPGSGPVSLSTKHTLALTNRGEATTEQLLALAREIRDGVRGSFGIELVNEPVTVGVEL